MHRVVLLPASGDKATVAIPVRNGSYLVGRSATCDIVVNDASVSRQHAQLSLNGDQLWVRDLRSRNGTFVDDERITSGIVRAGQMIRFGAAPYEIKFEGRVLQDDDDDETSRRPYAEEKVKTLSLRPSQRRVYDLLLAGVSEPEIAARLDLSVHTVHSHVKAIYSHFAVHSRAELLAQLLGTTRRR